MSDKNPDNKPDLLEAVDSLLGEIEETTQSFASPKEQGIGPNARSVDDGAVNPPPTPTAEPEDHDGPGPLSEAGEPVDSNDTATQALEAMETVESQTEDLIAMGIDALLHEADDTNASAPNEQSDDTAPSSDAQELIASIDQLLEGSREAKDEAPVPASAEPVIEPTAKPAVGPAVESAVEAQAEPDALEGTELEEPLDDPELLDESSLIIETHEPSNGSTDESMDLLDSALAEAADDMLDGDFETEEGELVSGDAFATEMEEALTDPSAEEPTAPAPESEDLLDQAVGDLLDADDQYASEPGVITQADEPAPAPATDAAPEPTPEATTQTTPETPPTAYNAEPTPVSETRTETPEPIEATPSPTPAPALDPEVQNELDALESVRTREPITVPAWFERSIEIVRPKVDRFDPLKGKTMDAVAMVLGSAIVAVMTYAPPLLSRSMILISKPLAKQSPEIRNAVGFIALWTGFLAAVVWIYLLMFRAPVVPTPEAAPTRVINADESMIAPVINQITP